MLDRLKRVRLALDPTGRNTLLNDWNRYLYLRVLPATLDVARGAVRLNVCYGRQFTIQAKTGSSGVRTHIHREGTRGSIGA